MGGAKHGVEDRREGGVAVWTLAQPERANGLSERVLARLGTLVAQAAQDATLRAVVITGAGERAFCAGADLKERQGMAADDVRALLLRYGALFDALDTLPHPVIAALNGAALGGGLELALACDLRVADPGARLGLPETALGVIPGAGGTQRLPRIVGPARAKELVILAQPWTAQQALAYGLLHAVASTPGGALQQALAWASRIAELAPLATRAALRALDGALERPLAEGLEHERDCYAPLLDTQDRDEALAAFAEKRKPRFSGR